MNVFVTGGTGDIGSAVVTALIDRDHAVSALARSPRAAGRLRAMGAEPVAGDIREPSGWIDAIRSVDAIIHMASTWAPDMDQTDAVVVGRLIDAAGASGRHPALVYTGGCWLYGETGDRVADESSPLAAPPVFQGALGTIERVAGASGVRGIVLHPAMVYEARGGVFRRFHDDARQTGRVRVIGSAATRWPLVHRDDLGELYALAMERGAGGEQYNGAAEAGVRVGDIALAVARVHDAEFLPDARPVEDVVRELGDWAEGFAIDQQMSGAKAMRDLGWQPRHNDAIEEIGSLR